MIENETSGGKLSSQEELWVSEELEVISVFVIRIVLRKHVRVTVRYASCCYCDDAVSGSGFVVGVIGGKGADLKDGIVFTPQRSTDLFLG